MSINVDNGSIVDRANFSAGDVNRLPVEALLAGELYARSGFIELVLKSKNFSLSQNDTKIKRFTDFLKVVRSAQTDGSVSRELTAQEKSDWNDVISQLGTGYLPNANTYSGLSTNIGVIEAKLDDLSTISQNLTISIKDLTNKRNECLALAASLEKANHDTALNVYSKFN